VPDKGAGFIFGIKVPDLFSRIRDKGAGFVFEDKRIKVPDLFSAG
jgi:hypothetical protein